MRSGAAWRWAGRVGVVLGVLLALTARGDLHVAPDGDDRNPGTRSKPFKTLEAARRAVRELQETGRIPGRGLTVWIESGDHLRSESLDLEAVDSGKPGAPIRWAGRGTGGARLLGGRRVDGWKAVTDPAVLDRLDPRAHGRVRVAELGTAGGPAGSYGSLQSRGFGRALTPAHSELFHGGRPMTLARWPDEGAFEQIAGFPEGRGRGDDHGGAIGDLPSGFLYSGDRPRRWRDTGDLWVHGYWAWDWANSYERVATLDTANRRVVTAAPHGLYGFRKGQRFYFLNVLEELDQPGEWYLDRVGGRLYFWPPEPGTGTAAGGGGGETLLSLLGEPLIRMRGVSHVTVEGLVLEATRASAIEISGGTGVQVAGCLIRNVGNYGVVVRGGTHHSVRSCDVLDTGDGGVDLLGGDRATLEPGGHVVENCHFQRQGRWSKCYVPSVHVQGVGHVVRHNLIHDHPHCAILYTGNDHRLEFNEIHHIALETGDVGAIYTGRNYTFRGNRILHNYIHHTGGVGMGSMGAYMDDCVSGTEIRGNIFHRVQRAAFIGGGRDHRVENNIFVECDPAVQVDGRGLDASPVWRGMVDKTMRAGVAEVPSALYRERYPEMTALDAFYGPPSGPAVEGTAFRGVPPENNRVVRNVVVGKWLQVGWQARKDMLLLDANWVGTDPRFVRTPGPDSTAADFVLRRDSPAWALGFEAIPVAKIGIQSDAWRRRLGRLRR